MADGQHSPSVQGKVCTKCGQWKASEQFKLKYGVKKPRGDGRRSLCMACDRLRARTWYARSPEYRVKASVNSARNQCSQKWRAKRKAKGLKTRSGWSRIREYVAVAAKRGREYWPPVTQYGEPCNGATRRRKDGYEGLVRLNARQAWTYWVKEKAPERWVREAYRSVGKPWNNPRLSGADKWRIRYWCDPVFRALEIEKVQRAKVKRRALIDATDDGSLTGTVIVALFSAAKTCHYCGRPMRSVEKSLDHVMPLSQGGHHSIGNVVVACKPCNFSKHARTPDEWRGKAA